MKINLTVISTLVFALALSACASTSSKNFHETDLQKLEVGKSTKHKVNKFAGYPLFAETYNKEQAIIKLEKLIGTPIPADSLNEGKYTLWIFPAYLAANDAPAHYNAYLLFDDEGVLRLARTN